MDTALQEYYSKISYKINQHDAVLVSGGEKYYIQKLKPFYVHGRTYYEVTFSPAKDTENKTGRVIAFTKLPIISNYASKFQLVNEKIEILGKTMPILLIVGWEVSIRACELKNLSSVVTGKKDDIPYGEQRTVSRFLTEKGFTLTELMDFPDDAYQRILASWRSELRTGVFFDTLDKCRDIIKMQKPGQNILRYLLYGMYNIIIKKQRQSESNNSLSGLYLKNGCRPFDRMPFMQSPIGHNPRLAALFDSIRTSNRKQELLARQIRNNTEISGRIFTPIEDLAHYGTIDKLARTYNATL